MNGREALAFFKKHGVVLMSARGPVPNLAEAMAGEPIRGSWWGHPKSLHMYRVFEEVSDSDQVLVCRLVGGKVTFVHRRLWPALVRVGSRLPRRGLAAVREEHTERGSHRILITAFPRWVPKQVLSRAKRLSVAEAVSEFGGDLLFRVSGLKFAEPVMKMKVPKAPWTAAARRRLAPPRGYSKAASSRRSPRRFAHFHLPWRAPGSCESVLEREPRSALS